MGAGLVKLGDDIRDGLPHAGDLRQSALFDETLEGDSERGQAVGRSGIRFGSVWIAAAQDTSLRVFAQQLRDLLPVSLGHRVSGHPTIFQQGAGGRGSGRLVASQEQRN
jgi:hypothetical protein